MTKIIAFEGIDGTGKSVQMAALADRLSARGCRVMQIAFPDYDSFFGREVGKLLSGSGGVRADQVDGKSMALWFALDRFEAFRHLSTAAADVVLINRYILSNAVYQSIRDCDLGKPDLLDFVLELEYAHFGIPRADIHLVLDMDISDASVNVGKKGFRAYVGESKDVYEAIPSIQARARLKYIEYAGRLDNVRVVCCTKDGALLPIDAIGALVDEALKDVFTAL